MTDNDRLFGPYRAAQLEPIEAAAAVERAINAWPTPLVDVGLFAAPDGTYVRVFRSPPALVIR